MADYAVKIVQRSDGLFVATFPDIPDVFAYGRDRDEALEEASKTLEATIRRRLLKGEDVPEPRSEGDLRVQQDILAAVLA